VLASDVLRTLLAIRKAHGDAASTLALQTRLAEMEPLDESVHRELIAQHLRHERTSEALRCYYALRQRMREELDRAPSFTLDDLSDALPDGTERF
jgi:DNA-binding SARP family transcriptional activator